MAFFPLMAPVPERRRSCCERLWREATTLVVPMLFAFFIYLGIGDAVHNRLGSSNGRFISFVDSCRSAAQYRKGLPLAYRNDPSRRAILLIFIESFLVKFAASTAVSLLLGMTPIMFMGPRHLMSFFAGWAFVWFSPRDMMYLVLHHSRGVRLLVDMGGGLYKMRKVIFAVEAAVNAKSHFYFALLLAVLSVDGTTLTRRSMLWLWARRVGKPASPVRNPMVRRISGDLTFSRLWSDSGHGVTKTLWSTVLPLGVVTALVWAAAREEWIAGITDDSFLNLRSALLTLFIWRAGAFDELAHIHNLCMQGVMVEQTVAAKESVTNAADCQYGRVFEDQNLPPNQEKIKAT